MQALVRVRDNGKTFSVLAPEPPKNPLFLQSIRIKR